MVATLTARKLSKDKPSNSKAELAKRCSLQGGRSCPHQCPYNRGNRARSTGDNGARGTSPQGRRLVALQIMADEPDNVILTMLRRRDAKVDRLSDDSAAHGRMLDILQQDTRLIRAAVNDVACTNATSGEVEGGSPR